MKIRPVAPGDSGEWFRLRAALWPDCTIERHRSEMAEYTSSQGSLIAIVAVRADGGLGGFLEASIRSFAEGCFTGPVGYVEGWYVDSDVRRLGVGAQLIRAAEAWASSLGCKEMASDCLVDNEVSRLAHSSLGYQEVLRLIHFKKQLRS